jgi:hypothetical protein
MPTLTQIKRRKLLPPHEIQQVEDDVEALMRNNEIDEKGGYLMLYSRKIDDNHDACLFVSVTEKDVARIKKTLTN